MKPYIGITCSFVSDMEKFALRKEYYQGIQEAGGMPLLLCHYGQDDINELMSILDGVLLSGGGDIDPRYFSEEPLPGLGEVDLNRDEFEINIARACVKNSKPLFGICRGIQVINVAMEGNLYQDLDSQWGKGRLMHSQKAPASQSSHRVLLEKGTALYDIMGMKEEIWVNSFHHQSVKDIAPGLRVSAYAPDGVIEAIEGEAGDKILGVQWHPERMWKTNINMYALFQYFVNWCKK